MNTGLLLKEVRRWHALHLVHGDLASDSQASARLLLGDTLPGRSVAGDRRDGADFKLAWIPACAGTTLVDGDAACPSYDRHARGGEHHASYPLACSGALGTRCQGAAWHVLVAMGQASSLRGSPPARG